MKKNRIFVFSFSAVYFARLDYVLIFNSESWGENDDVIKIEEYKYSPGNL